MTSSLSLQHQALFPLKRNAELDNFCDASRTYFGLILPIIDLVESGFCAAFDDLFYPP